NFANTFLIVTLFTLLYEICILANTCHVMNNADTMFFSISPQFFKVCHTDWLTSCHIYISSYAYIWNFLSSMFLYQFVEFTDINIAFKWMFVERVMSFINDNICKCSTCQFLMQTC